MRALTGWLPDGAEPELWRVEVIKRLPNLKTLDGLMVEDTEREEALSL